VVADQVWREDVGTNIMEVSQDISQCTRLRNLVRTARDIEFYPIARRQDQEFVGGKSLG